MNRSFNITSDNVLEANVMFDKDELIMMLEGGVVYLECAGIMLAFKMEEHASEKEDATHINDTCDDCVHLNGGIGENVCFICTRNKASVRCACTTDHYKKE